VGSAGCGDIGYAADVDGSGNVYVTGSFQGTVDFNPSNSTANLTSTGIADAFIAKYTASGGYIWAFRLGGASTTDGDYGTAIALDANADIVVTGAFNGTVDFNPGTGTANLTAAGSSGIFIARYSASGGYQWAFTPAQGTHNRVTLDAGGDIYVIGSFIGPNDFDPGTGTATLPGGANGAGGFVAKYDALGAHLWSFSTTGTQGAPVGTGLTLDGSGAITIMGRFYGTGAFDPGDPNVTLTSAGMQDIFIAKYVEPTLPKRSVVMSDLSRMQVAPNPFTSDFTFRHDGAAPARIEIIDMMGRVVESRDADGATEISLGAELPAGAYVVRTTQGETRRQVMVRKER
jgi:hypothetical protein